MRSGSGCLPFTCKALSETFGGWLYHSAVNTPKSMRLRGDNFVSYIIRLQGVCRRHARVCRCQIPACVSATPPHTLRTEPARCGLRALQGRGFVNCKQLLEIAIGNAVFLRIGAQMAADFPLAVIKERCEKCLQYFSLVIIKVKFLRLGHKDKVFFVFLRLLY